MKRAERSWRIDHKSQEQFNVDSLNSVRMCNLVCG